MTTHIKDGAIAVKLYSLEKQIEEKNKEIESLNNKIHDISVTLNETYNNRTELRNENKRLNNITDELEKWLESEIDRVIKLKSPKRRSIPPYGAENYCYENTILRYKEVLDKLNKLKRK